MQNSLSARPATSLTHVLFTIVSNAVFLSLQVYFYVKNRQILGCLVAEPVSTAFKMLEMEGDVDVCSRESYPVKCGVSRIWVKSGHRREGIATKLMNALRGGFMFANILKRTDLAFSSPTTDGKLFAKKYCDSPTFFVYM